MYRGFKLDAISITDAGLKQELLNLGEQSYSTHKKVCEDNLRKFMSANNSLDATAIAASWFPQIKADVFLSHSHADEEMAKIIAGMFSKYLRLHTFIDSCVWGYSENLLKLIDEEYCQNEDRKTYNYNKRNCSTSHVHMMLSSAISTMIDRTECLFFLNSPNSIIPNKSIEKTQSPWLYYEIGITQIVRKNIPERILIEDDRTFSKKQLLEKAMQVEYEVDLNHLNKIDFELFKTWITSKNVTSPYDALDKLYLLSPEKRYSNSLHS